MDQSGNSGLADSTFPEQAFSNVLSHVEGARRGFSARGPEKQLFGPRKALGGGMKRGAWSLGQYVVFAHWMLCSPVGYVERRGPFLP